MDYTTWLEFQQNQTQIPNSALPSYPPPPPPSLATVEVAASSYPPPQSSYTAQYIPYTQNPNPTSTSSHVATVVEPGVNPPSGVESYVSPLPMATQVLGHEQPHLVPKYSYSEIQTQVADPSSLVASSGYYFDPNAQSWAAWEAVRLYGADPVTYGADVNSMPSNGTEQLAVPNPNPTWWTNTAAQPHVTLPPGNGTWKKYPKKAKTKIVQPAYCEVCKIDCTSKEVLDQHKLGKKHKKNVEKLRELLRPPQQVHQPGLVSSNPVIGPQLPAAKSKSASGSKRKTAETPEELEKKKKKVLEGGAAAEAVRICAVCNVICNSETVFNYHLAGQKHAALMKKASGQHRQSIAG